MDGKKTTKNHTTKQNTKKKTQPQKPLVLIIQTGKAELDSFYVGMAGLDWCAKYNHLGIENHTIIKQANFQ